MVYFDPSSTLWQDDQLFCDNRLPPNVRVPGENCMTEIHCRFTFMRHRESERESIEVMKGRTRIGGGETYLSNRSLLL